MPTEMTVRNAELSIPLEGCHQHSALVRNGGAVCNLL